VSLSLTDAERADLLARPHVGVLAVAGGDGRPPVATPVWFALDEGDIAVVTARQSKKARLAEAAGRVTFLVHEDMPPRHAIADADVVVEAPDEAIRRRIAERYVPPEMVDGYLAATADADTVVLRLRVRSWSTTDLSKA